jgi:AcrR family transcriptional regulator
MSQLSQFEHGTARTTGDSRERILDAAGRCVANVGIARTTLTDVARGAGVSRMTVYRHYAGVEAILQDLMTREFNAIVDDAVSARPAGGAVTRREIVAGVIASLEALTAHPLFGRILTTDAELLLPYLTERPGRFQSHAEGVLAGALAAGIATGEVRDDDPARLAATIVLALRGYALTAKDDWSDARRSAVLDDLSRMLDGLLAGEDAR